MPKPNSKFKYPVQITLTKEEYELLRKEAYLVDKTINTYIKEMVLKVARKE